MADDLFTAQQLAEKGIEESHAHAEEAVPGWSERAIAKVAAYARFHPEFLTEDVKAWSYEDGLDEANDSAWGWVMRKAADRQLIHRWGEKAATSPGSHGKLMAVWRRGPKPQGMVTRAEALDDAAMLDRFAQQMSNEGRRLMAEALTKAARNIRSLVNA